MSNKKIFVCFGIVSLMLFSFGCKKDDNTTNSLIETNTNNIINDSDISQNEKENEKKLLNDVDSITKEENNTTTFSVVSDFENETSSKEISLEKLTFGNWGFEISLPKEIVNNYELVDDISNLNITNIEEMSKTYVISNDACFQLFNLDTKYFGIFIDKEIYNENWQKAINDELYDYIKQIVPNNSFYSYDDTKMASKKIYGDNAILIKIPVHITPISDKEIVYNGYIGYLTIDDVVYYILYGENSLYYSSLKDDGYANFVFSSIEVLESFIKEDIKKEELENIDNELLDRIKKDMSIN